MGYRGVTLPGVLAVLFLACIMVTTARCTTKGVTPSPQPTGSVVEPPADTGTCKDACENLRKNGCEEALNAEDGTTCDSVCSLGAIRVTYDLSCVAKIQGCELEVCRK